MPKAAVSYGVGSESRRLFRLKGLLIAHASKKRADGRFVFRTYRDFLGNVEAYPIWRSRLIGPVYDLLDHTSYDLQLRKLARTAWIAARGSPFATRARRFKKR